MSSDIFDSDDDLSLFHHEFEDIDYEEKEDEFYELLKSIPRIDTPKAASTPKVTPVIFNLQQDNSVMEKPKSK